MAYPNNEVAADNQRREMEKWGKMPGGGLVTGVKNIVSLIPGAGPIANAIGLSKILLEVGFSSVEENINYLGQATAYALDRTERLLQAQGVRLDDLAQRYQSDAFVACLQAIALQTQRTRQRARLVRLANILANSVASNEIEPEVVDDLARAATELTEWDVQVLNDVHHCESTYENASGYLFSWWQEYWRAFPEKYPNHTLRAAAGTLGKLQSFGFVYGAEGTSLVASPVSALYRLSEEGERFLQRIRALSDSEGQGPEFA